MEASVSKHNGLYARSLINMMQMFIGEQEEDKNEKPFKKYILFIAVLYDSV